mmetsp:Transcript_43887/g.139785  ORF Transcript_43887/g.139785 Transcript_43887/m.139785 type:complete len:142 (-) Transcript_43887:172-597(-)
MYSPLNTLYASSVPELERLAAKAAVPSDDEGSKVKAFSPSTLYEGVPSVFVQVAKGQHEEVLLDPERGPGVLQPNGETVFAERLPFSGNSRSVRCGPTREYLPWASFSKTHKSWQQMTSTEQGCMVQIIAKRNWSIRQNAA